MTDLTPREEKIIKHATTIATEEPSDINFLHTSLCQCHLPRRKVDERTFVRSNGTASLRIDAGELWDGKTWQAQPLPYGVKPRLIMLYLTTYAIRHRTRTVPVERSLAGFLRVLGLTTSGGKRGTYRPFRAQMKALAAARLTLGYVDRQGLPSTRAAQPIEEFRAWLHPTGRQRALWPGEIMLSDPFYETLLELAVPLDQRAIAALSKSSLDLDIYTWLAHRLHRAPDKGQIIHWKSLRKQFGPEYQSSTNFKKAFLASLRRAVAVYPTANIEQCKGGLRLKASPPPIPKTQSVTPFIKPPFE